MKLNTVLFFIFLTFMNSYPQSSESIYLNAAELINKRDSNSLNTIINLLEKSISIDNNFIEAHFQLAESFMDWELKKSKIKQAKFHYDKAISLLEHGIKLRLIDSLTERTIYRNVAFAYDNIFNLNINDNRDYYEKSIELYYKALAYPYSPIDFSDPRAIDFDSEFEIKKAIAECYESLARIDKFESNFISAIGNLYDAKKVYKEINYYDFIYEHLDKEISINNVAYQNRNWQLFNLENTTKLIPAMRYIKELISANDFLYFFNKSSVENISKNVIRVWLLSVNLKSIDSLGTNDEYENKILAEFDLKSKKCRQLKHITYNKDSEVIDEYSSEKSKWDFIAPDTIYEEILIYFNKQYDRNN